MADFTKAIEHLKQAEACLERARLAIREAGLPKGERYRSVDAALMVTRVVREGFEGLMGEGNDTKA